MRNKIYIFTVSSRKSFTAMTLRDLKNGTKTDILSQKTEICRIEY